MTYRRATHAYELVAARSVGGKGTLHEIIKEGKVDGRVPKNVENILPPKKKKLKEGQYVNYIDKRARGKTILTTKIYGVRKKKRRYNRSKHLVGISGDTRLVSTIHSLYITRQYQHGTEYPGTQ